MSDEAVYLIQTDTTVGFLSRSSIRLAAAKSRPPQKPFLKVCDSFKTLNTFIRVPNAHKNFVRRARACTFVCNHQALRVVHDPIHLRFVQRLKWCYSTSANASGTRYDAEFAHACADVVVTDRRGLSERTPSRIIRLGHTRTKRLR